ncbi:hypothetical protein ACIBCR_06730 [Micromonospora echinospora]|uniref:hypothetical protein n=1 Tax=Micromonospora echinospora TaxID=1877 RepID=UPI0037974B57
MSRRVTLGASNDSPAATVRIVTLLLAVGTLGCVAVLVARVGRVLRVRAPGTAVGQEGQPPG